MAREKILAHFFARSELAASISQIKTKFFEYGDD